MQLITGDSISQSTLNQNLKRITNQIYKLLPMREEGFNWQLPLDTIIEELGGMGILIPYQEDKFFSLLCKLKGLSLLINEEDFNLYRRTIFECLGIMGELVKCLDMKH